MKLSRKPIQFPELLTKSNPKWEATLKDIESTKNKNAKKS